MAAKTTAPTQQPALASPSVAMAENWALEVSRTPAFRKLKLASPELLQGRAFTTGQDVHLPPSEHGLGSELAHAAARAASPSDLPPETRAGSPSHNGLAGKLAEAVKKFKPLLEQAIVAHPDRRTVLVAAITQIRDQIKTEQFDAARANTMALGGLLKSLTSGTPPPAPPAPPASAPPNAASLQAVFAKLQPVIQKALESPSPDADTLRAAVERFQSLLQAGTLDEARATLLTLGPLAKSLAAGAAGTGELSLVRLGKARLEWLELWRHGVAEISRVKTALIREFGDDAEQAGALVKALKELDATSHEFQNDLHEQLDAVLNAAVESRPPLIAAAKGTIARFNSLLLQPLLQVLDDNEAVPGMLVVAPLRAKLQEISAALA